MLAPHSCEFASSKFTRGSCTNIRSTLSQSHVSFDSRSKYRLVVERERGEARVWNIREQNKCISYFQKLQENFSSIPVRLNFVKLVNTYVCVIYIIHPLFKLCIMYVIY